MARPGGRTRADERVAYLSRQTANSKLQKVAPLKHFRDLFVRASRARSFLKAFFNFNSPHPQTFFTFLSSRFSPDFYCSRFLIPIGFLYHSPCANSASLKGIGGLKSLHQQLLGKP